MTPPRRFSQTQMRQPNPYSKQLNCTLRILSGSLLNTPQWEPWLQETNWTLRTPAGNDQGGNFARSANYSNFPEYKALFLTQTQKTLGPKEVPPLPPGDRTSSEEPDPKNPWPVSQTYFSWKLIVRNMYLQYL